jgi:hypothetical protein
MNRFLTVLTFACVEMMAISQAAGLDGASRAAMEFCESLEHGLPDLKAGGDTAISPAVERKKRTTIRKRLERLAMGLAGKELRVAAAEMDDDLAGIMIEVLEPWEPSDAQLLGLAMVRSEGGWKPAPVPGSFENALIPATAKIRERTKRLEFWMLSRQSTGLQSLIDREWEKLKSRLTAAVPPESRRELPPRTVVERFLASCRAKDHLQMLAWCEPGTDWSEIEDWISTGRESAEWDWVLAPETPWALSRIDTVGQENTVRVGLCCFRMGELDGRAVDELEKLLEFTLRRADKESPWYLVPPPFRDGEPDWKPLSSRELELFRYALIEAAAFTPIPGETPEERMLNALRHETPMGLLGMIRNSESTSVKVVREALKAWSALQGTGAPVILDRFEGEAHKAWLLLGFQPRQPARCMPIFLNMMAPELDRWQLVASEAMPPEQRNWVSRARANVEETWLSLLLEDAFVLSADAPAAASPSEIQVKDALERWHDSIRRVAPLELAARSALLPGEAAGQRLCEGLASSFRDMEAPNTKPTLEAVHSKSPFSFAVVAYQTVSGTARRRLLLMTQTADRIRILPEMNLVLGGGRSADFLNRVQLRRLEAYSKEAVAGVTAVFTAESTRETN